jgi:hypothetical protein
MYFLPRNVGEKKISCQENNLIFVSSENVSNCGKKHGPVHLKVKWSVNDISIKYEL